MITINPQVEDVIPADRIDAFLAQGKPIVQEVVNLTRRWLSGISDPNPFENELVAKLYERSVMKDVHVERIQDVLALLPYLPLSTRSEPHPDYAMQVREVVFLLKLGMISLQHVIPQKVINDAVVNSIEWGDITVFQALIRKHPRLVTSLSGKSIEAIFHQRDPHFVNLYLFQDGEKFKYTPQ